MTDNKDTKTLLCCECQHCEENNIFAFTIMTDSLFQNRGGNADTDFAKDLTIYWRVV